MFCYKNIKTSSMEVRVFQPALEAGKRRFKSCLLDMKIVLWIKWSWGLLGVAVCLSSSTNRRVRIPSGPHIDVSTWLKISQTWEISWVGNTCSDKRLSCKWRFDSFYILPTGLLGESGRPRIPVTDENTGSNPVQTAKQSRGRIALERLRKMHLASFKFLKWDGGQGSQDSL